MDHILPYSKSLDDSLMNKALCFRTQNDEKGQRTVYEWLAETKPAKYEEILQRAARLPIEIRNRKRAKFSQKTCELEQFINRQLTDTAYITILVTEYIRTLGVDVLGSKGQLTAEQRYDWGLNTILRDDGRNSKNREDHRHHAIDAIVIALTNRSRLQQLARRMPDEALPPPWQTFREDVERIIDTINVSHRASRKVSGALHEETTYGLTQKKPGGEIKDRPWAKQWIEQDRVYVLRKSLEALSLNEVAKIRDERVREIVIARLKEFGLIAGRQITDESADGEEHSSGKSIPKRVWEKPLLLLPRKPKEGQTGMVIRKVRLIKPEESIVPLSKVFILRKPLASLELNEVAEIRDERIRELVIARLAEFGIVANLVMTEKPHGSHEESPGTAIPERVWEKPLVLPSIGVKKRQADTVIRRLQLIKPELGNRNAKFVKPGSLHHVALFETTDTRGKIKRHPVFVSMLEASRRVREKQALIERRHPTIPEARFLMSFSRGEMIKGIFKGQERLVRFSTAASTQGQLYFVEHTDARPAAQVVRFAVKANTLRGSKVLVDVLGRIRRAND